METPQSEIRAVRLEILVHAYKNRQIFVDPSETYIHHACKYEF